MEVAVCHYSSILSPSYYYYYYYYYDTNNHRPSSCFYLKDINFVLFVALSIIAAVRDEMNYAPLVHVVVVVVVPLLVFALKNILSETAHAISILPNFPFNNLSTRPERKDTTAREVVHPSHLSPETSLFLLGESCSPVLLYPAPSRIDALSFTAYFHFLLKI